VGRKGTTSGKPLLVGGEREKAPVMALCVNGAEGVKGTFTGTRRVGDGNKAYTYRQSQINGRESGIGAGMRSSDDGR